MPSVCSLQAGAGAPGGSHVAVPGDQLSASNTSPSLETQKGPQEAAPWGNRDKEPWPGFESQCHPGLRVWPGAGPCPSRGGSPPVLHVLHRVRQGMAQGLRQEGSHSAGDHGDSAVDEERRGGEELGGQAHQGAGDAAHAGHGAAHPQACLPVGPAGEGLVSVLA